jgi:phosphopantothenate-cysteine ligase/phosphopantothenoylcysteine decarboxylase/phosphopantothenate--cysteine ligase
MNILVTAGNTQVLIDRVRSITNIFTGRTGTGIALHCHAHGHSVALLTSHPEVIDTLRPAEQSLAHRWQLFPYRTFEELRHLLQHHLSHDPPDVVIHSAAVSDYRAAGIYAAAPGTTFDPNTQIWQGTPPSLVDMSAGKVKSSEPELWLRLTRTPKLIDLFRADWGFRGILVKFKLEVGVDEAALLDIAEASRRQSGADLMVANTLEGAQSWALLGPLANGYQRIERGALAARLLGAVNALVKGQSNG